MRARDDCVQRLREPVHIFLGQDGKIPVALMPDQLHPNAAGYAIILGYALACMAFAPPEIAAAVPAGDAAD